MAKGTSTESAGLTDLVLQYLPMVYGVCHRRLRDPQRAGEAAAGAFWVVSRAGADRPAGKVVAHLFESAMLACDCTIRGGFKPPEASSNPGGPWVDWNRIAGKIDEAIDTLGGDELSAFLLKYVLNQSVDRVAGVLGISQIQAGRKLSVAVRSVRGRMGREGIDIGAEALVAQVQAKAAGVVPLDVRERLRELTAADGAPQVQKLARTIRATVFKWRAISISSIVVVSLLLAVAAWQTWALLHRVSTPTQVAGDPDDPTPPTNVQTPTRPASRPRSVSQGNWPATQPVRAVNPVLAKELFFAIRNGQPNYVAGAIASDSAAVNAVDPDTRRPAVEVAAERVDMKNRESATIARILIDKGAVVDFHTAARAGHKDHVVRMLEAHSRLLNSLDAQGRTALQRAVLHTGYSEDCKTVAAELIAWGARVDLGSACTLVRLDDVKRELDADPSPVNSEFAGLTPLHWAVRPREHGPGAVAIVKLLLERGADCRAIDRAHNGTTPLHAAIDWGDQPDLVNAMLDSKIDPNPLDDYARTPLDYAIAGDAMHCIETLKARGGRRTTQDLPESLAKAPRFFAAIRAGKVADVKALLDDTPDLATSRGPEGETPMHLAATIGSPAIIDLLLADKADINAHEWNKLGGTPLHWAVRANQLQAAQHLVSKGADPRSINQRTGQTLLHVAVKHNASPPLVQWIKGLGIDANARDRWGKIAGE